MPLLTVHHRTTYRYRKPVAFGEHRMMLRPRDSHDQHMLEALLEITPRPSGLRWLHDPFGNNVAIARFSGRAPELTFTSTLRVEHDVQDPALIAAGLNDNVPTYPFSYDSDDLPDLARCVERGYPDTSHRLDAWMRSRGYA